MNEYDSELVGTILSGGGYRMTESESDADVILFNTCAVRETAHTRIYARLGALMSAKRTRNGDRPLTVGVLGCMAQNLQEKLLLEFPAVDFICGPDGYRELPRLIADARGLRERGMAIELSEYETYDDIAPTRVEGVNAWIAVMRGCDNFCTFCVVPYTRGRERSRDPRGVVAEVERLAGQGYKQVTLLGQNVNSYRHHEHDFADLLRMTASVNGIDRVRFTSPHPKDFPVRLIANIRDIPELCPHIHLPLQAGSSRVLKKMNRGYAKDEFRRLADTICATIPDVAITTDIIAGFPTETDAEFRETEAVMREVAFDAAFIFKYSERVGTLAAKLWDDDVPETVKSERVTHLVDVQRGISLKKNRELVGGTLEVLIEGTSKKDATELRARAEDNRMVVFPASEHTTVGTCCHVTITEATPNTLIGRLA